PALDELETTAGTVNYQPAALPLVSNVTGQVLAPGEVLDGAYWRRQARAPVQFARGVQTLAELGCTGLLEVGPQPVLTSLAAACWPGERPPGLVASLQRGVADERQLCQALAQLYVQGVTPDFATFDRPWRRRKLVLPTYPFQRQRYWVDAPPPMPP